MSGTLPARTGAAQGAMCPAELGGQETPEQGQGEVRAWWGKVPIMLALDWLRNDRDREAWSKAEAAAYVVLVDLHRREGAVSSRALANVLRVSPGHAARLVTRLIKRDAMRRVGRAANGSRYAFAWLDFQPREGSTCPPRFSAPRRRQFGRPFDPAVDQTDPPAFDPAVDQTFDPAVDQTEGGPPLTKRSGSNRPSMDRKPGAREKARRWEGRTVERILAEAQRAELGTYEWTQVTRYLDKAESLRAELGAPRVCWVRYLKTQIQDPTIRVGVRMSPLGVAFSKRRVARYLTRALEARRRMAEHARESHVAELSAEERAENARRAEEAMRELFG